jgi:hypothetical protein
VRVSSTAGTRGGCLMGGLTDGLVESSDGLVEGSPANPSPTFPQVNPSESVADDGLEGSLGSSAYRNRSFIKTPAPTSLRSVADLEPEARETTNPSPPTDSLGLTCGNVVEGGGQDDPVTPSPLVWPSDPAWERRWQTKLDAARTPQERADCAWRVLQAGAHKARLTPDDDLFDQVANILTDLASDLGVGRALSHRARPAAARPGVPKAPGVTDLHHTIARQEGCSSADILKIEQAIRAGATDVEIDAKFFLADGTDGAARIREALT